MHRGQRFQPSFTVTEYRAITWILAVQADSTMGWMVHSLPPTAHPLQHLLPSTAAGGVLYLHTPNNHQQLQ